MVRSVDAYQKHHARIYRKHFAMRKFHFTTKYCCTTVGVCVCVSYVLEQRNRPAQQKSISSKGVASKSSLLSSNLCHRVFTYRFA